MILKWEGMEYSPIELIEQIQQSRLITTNRGIKYYNCPVAFDIETSSFKWNNIELGSMYIWMFSVNGYVTMGRTWEDFLTLYNLMVKELGLNSKKRLVIYIHNYSYEFQFIAKWLKWDKLFSLKPHSPLFGITVDGVEFRCSYMLSGLSLEKTAENLTRYKAKKAVGDLDYKVIRGNKTQLSEEELNYCAMDVITLNAYIQECIESDGDITRIPYTATGYVRRYCRLETLYLNGNTKKRNRKYNELMRELTLEPEEFTQLRQTFQGGFAHANAYAVDKIFSNVGSFDFGSSYPAVMVYEKFPMSKGKKVDVKSKEEFELLLKSHCVMFKAHFFRLTGTQFYEDLLSKHKILTRGKVIVNNGRIVYADECLAYINEVDFESIKKFYEWENLSISDIWVYRKGYLPTEFVKAILKLYQDKTELKGKVGKEEEYQKSKGMLNSTYGCSTTNPVRDIIEYSPENGWSKTPSDLEEAIEKYNKDCKRFLFYPWGVWITSYARRNLFTGIYEFKEDYLASDTDSLKVVNYEKHMDYINNFNSWVERKLHAAMEYHNLPYDLVSPKTIDGKIKVLGFWEFEGVYKKFKTLGAKRYIVQAPNKETGELEIQITVAGLGKIKGAKYLQEKFGMDGAMEAFNKSLYIPPEGSGKLTHKYSPDGLELEGDFTDYQGNKCHFHEKGWVYLEPQGYDMSLSVEFIMYLLGLEPDDEYNPRS